MSDGQSARWPLRHTVLPDYWLTTHSIFVKSVRINQFWCPRSEEPVTISGWDLSRKNYRDGANKRWKNFITVTSTDLLDSVWQTWLFFPVQISPNPFSSGAPHRIPTGSLYNAPQTTSWLERGHPSPALSPSSASSFPVGPRRCGVRRAHQMVNPALSITAITRTNHRTLQEYVWSGSAREGNVHADDTVRG